MAEENIDKTPNGTGPFNVKIPGLSDPADIQEALRIYHYGSSTYDSSAPIPPALLPYSVAGHLHKLKTGNISFLYATLADFPDPIINHGYIAHAHSTGKLYLAHNGEWIPLTDEDFVANAILAAVSGTTGGYPDLAGAGIDWNSIDTQFDLEPRINNTGTVIEKTASFGLLAEDVSKTILLNTSSGMNLTIPANSSVAIPVGYQYHLVEIGSGTTTFVPASGVTVGSKNSQLFLDGRYSKATLVKIATDSWVLYGDIYEGVAIVTTTPAPTTTVAPTTTTTTVAPTTPAPTGTTPAPTPDPTPTPTGTTPAPTGTTPAPTGTTSTTTTTTTPAPTGTTPAPLPTISSFSAQCEHPDTGTCVDGNTTQAIWTVFNYSNASSYQITASPSTSNGSTYTSNANSDTDKYLGLGTKGTTYTLTLTVYSLDNQQGTSASQTISYTVPSTPTPTTTTTPAPDTFAITSTSSTTNSVTYSWSNAPAGTVSYDVYYASPDILYTSTNQSGTSKTYGNLTHSTDYTVFVRAKNSSGSVLASANATITTQAITTTSTTTTTAAPLTTYYACCNNGAGVQGNYANSSAAVTGLNIKCAEDEPGINNQVQGGVSTTPTGCNSATTTTTTTAAPATTTTTPAPDTFAITSTSSTTNSVTYSWSNAPAGTVSYDVYYASPDIVYTSTNQSGTSKTYGNLTHSTDYTVFVRAKNSSGSVLASDNATITTQAIGTTTTTTTTAAPLTPAPTTAAPTTAAPTTAAPCQEFYCAAYGEYICVGDFCPSNTAAPTTAAPTTAAPTTAAPTTAAPTTAAPTTAAPLTPAPTTAAPTTAAPCQEFYCAAYGEYICVGDFCPSNTAAPTTAAPTTAAPTTAAPTTAAPTTTTAAPTTTGVTCTSFDVSIGCCASTGCSTECGSGAACSNPPFNRCYQGGMGC